MARRTLPLSHAARSRIVPLLAASLAVACAAVLSPPFTSPELLGRHNGELGSPRMEGRRAGELGGQLAADYIAAAFREAQLYPAGEGATYLQEFELITTARPGRNTSLVVRHRGSGDLVDEIGRTARYTAGSDFAPLAFSGTGEVRAAGVVAAGYGIVASALAHDDYAGAAVRGKAVLVFRYAPGGGDGGSPYAPYMPLRAKAAWARERGAAALLVVPPRLPQGETGDSALPDDGSAFADAGLPVVTVSRAVAEHLLAGSGTTLDALQLAADEPGAQRRGGARELVSPRLSLRVDHERESRRAVNVAGLVTGSDTMRALDLVVVGVSYDRARGSGRDARGNTAPTVASDDVSAVAAFIELARAFGSGRLRCKRSLLFVAFAASENGLLGAEQYLRAPLRPLADTVAMIELLPAGRWRGAGVAIGGADTASQWNDWIAAANRPGPELAIAMSARHMGSGNHASFAAKGIPVLSLALGRDPASAQAGSAAPPAEMDATERLTRLVAGTLRRLGTSPTRPSRARHGA